MNHKTERKECLFDKYDKKLKWLPFQHGLAEMTQS